MLLSILYGCKDERKYREDIKADVSVEIKPSKETLTLSSIVATFDLIAPKGILLANISKVLECDSFILIKGKSADGDIHLFDKEGNYLETILKRGEGPEEAANVKAMKIWGNDVFLLVNVGTEVMRYSLSQRRFVDRFRLPDEIFASADFEILNENKYVFYKDIANGNSENEWKLYVYDKKFKKVDYKWIPLNSKSTEYISFGQTDCLYHLNNKFYFYEIFQNGIYELNEESIKGHIAFKNNKYSFPNNCLYGSYTFDSFIQFCKESPYVWAHRDMYEGNHFMISNYIYKNNFYWNVIDKKKNISNSYLAINDDVLLDGIFSTEDYLYQTNCQDSIYYFTLSYSSLDEIMQHKVEGDEFLEKHHELQQIYKNMDEDTNDIIIKFYEKQ